MGMNSALSVSLISLSAALVTPVRQIITWLLDIKGAENINLCLSPMSNARSVWFDPVAEPTVYLPAPPSCINMNLKPNSGRLFQVWFNISNHSA